MIMCSSLAALKKRGNIQVIKRGKRIFLVPKKKKNVLDFGIRRFKARQGG